MATGTGNLPYPGKSYTPFDILTAEELNEDVANIESLADGSGRGDGSVTTTQLADQSVAFSKVDWSTFGQVDANGWTDYGIVFVKAITFSGTGNITANGTLASNFASNFGVPVNGVTPSVSNTRLEKILTTNTSNSDKVIMQRGLSVFAVSWFNAGNATGQVGNVTIIATVFGRA